MSPRVGLVINPFAGAGRGAQVAAEVRAVLGDLSATVVDLSAPDALRALGRAHAEVRRGTIDALVVVGGDGMAHLGLNAVAGTGVPLGHISVGSGNDLARALGLPVNQHVDSLRLIHAALDPADPTAGPRALDAIEVTRPTAAPLVDGAASSSATSSAVAGSTHGSAARGAGGAVSSSSATADADGAPRLSLVPGAPDVRWVASSLVLGIGAAVNISANRYRHPRGRTKYLRAVVAETLRFSPYGMATETDGELWEGPATLLTLANTALFGGGLPVAPDAVPDDGLMDVVHIDAVGRLMISTLFPRFMRGTHTSLEQVRITRAAEVLVRDAPGSGRPMPIAMGDGEEVGPLPLRVRVVPGAWQVLAPVAPVPTT